MPYLTKEITKDIYDHAQANNGYITEADENIVFDICELLGYGIYGAKAYAENNKYYCRYYRGSNCD
jgi:hypothetical protein